MLYEKPQGDERSVTERMGKYEGICLLSGGESKSADNEL